MLGDEGKRTKNKEKVKQGVRMRRRSSVELFFKCEVLLVTTLQPSLPSFLWLSENQHLTGWVLAILGR